MKKTEIIIKIRFLIILLMTICLGITNISFASNEELTSDEEQYENCLIDDELLPYTKAYIEWLKLPEEERKNTLQPRMFTKDMSDTQKTSLAATRLKVSSKYDLRESINVKLKDQKQTGTCWAFATTTVLETYMSKMKNKAVEFSPRHMEYATSRTFLDGINDVVFGREVDDGGNIAIAASYMTSGLGPVYEADMPFINSTKHINLSEIKKEPRLMLKEYITFPGIYKEINNGRIKYTNGGRGQDNKEYDYTQVEKIRNSVKEHINKYGAVSTWMAYYKDFFSRDGKSFYSNVNNIAPNHGVSIIGWDDNYPVSNFNNKARPTNPGAWLIQNSWGNERSYFYVSYDDILIEEWIFGVIELSDVNYDNIYQHNQAIPNSEIPTFSKTAYAMNIFKKDENNEFLNEITFFTSPDAEYEIYVNPYDGTTDKDKYIKVKSVGKTDSDYVTVELDEPITLPQNEFGVMVKYSSESEDVVIPTEKQSNEVFTYKYCKSNPGECFYTVDIEDYEFIDLTKCFENTNICIKAFTNEKTTNPKSILTCKNYKVEDVKNLTNNFSGLQLRVRKDDGTYEDIKNVINGVLPNTTLEEFEDDILINAKYKIENKNNNTVTEDMLITTGMTMTTDLNEKYIITVKGDVNGDGKITGTDVLNTKWHVLEMEDKELNGEYLIASDFNEDGKTTATDVLNIKQETVK